MYESLLVFILACFVGYYAVLKVTPSLHAPLMSVTNAISSIVVVVALDASAINPLKNMANFSTSAWFGIAAVFLLAVNIFGGFLLTKKMLAMFCKKNQNSSKNSEMAARKVDEKILTTKEIEK